MGWPVVISSELGKFMSCDVKRRATVSVTAEQRLFMHLHSTAHLIGLGQHGGNVKINWRVKEMNWKKEEK